MVLALMMKRMTPLTIDEERGERTNMDLEKLTREYAGRDYARPRTIAVGSLDLFDESASDIDELMELLIAFRDKHRDADITCTFERGYIDEYPEAIITATRMETEEECGARAEETRRRAAQFFEEQKKTARYYAEKYLNTDTV